jgi:glycosyltransferase involved in cell wall biosynthesis
MVHPSPFYPQSPSMHLGVVAETNSFHTEKWTRALQEAGVEVTVFTLSPHQIPGVRCVRVQPRFTRKGELTYLSYLGSGDRLRKALLAHRVDLVNPINVTPHGAWARRARIHPMVMVSMGADILEYPPQPSQRIAAARSWESNHVDETWWDRLRYALKWPVFRHEVQQALRAADLITGDNLQLVEAVQAWFGVPPAKTYLHRWGIDERLFDPDAAIQAELRQHMKLQADQRVLLSPRGLKPIYQGDLILSAFERVLARQRSDLKLIALGTYQVPAELDQKARNLAAQYPAFHYQRERLPRAQVAQLWRLTDAFVNLPVYDGFSNALCEGRYVGAVPLVQDIPAHREVLAPDRHALYVDPLTPETLAQRIEYWAEHHPQLQPAMATANHAWIMTHAHLGRNTRAFLDRCEALISART